MTTKTPKLPETVIRNANIITMDPANPSAEWVALSDGIIQAIGTGRDYQRFASRGSTLIDCRGGTVLPGFIDAHLHLHAFAESCVSLNLTHSLGFKSITDIGGAIRNQCQKKTARNLDQSKGVQRILPG